MPKKDDLKNSFLGKDVRTKLKSVKQHIQTSDISQETKNSLLAKSERLEQAVGTSKFNESLEEFITLLLEYEQYIPALFEFLKL